MENFCGDNDDSNAFKLMMIIINKWELFYNQPEHLQNQREITSRSRVSKYSLAIRITFLPLSIESRSKINVPAVARL